MRYELPNSVEIHGEEFPIRSDFRAVLDICTALSDEDLSVQERAIVALGIFYPTIDDMPAEWYEDALKECFKFINDGDEEEKEQQQTRLVYWEKDFPIIVAPINRVIGHEIRQGEPIHWWTFLSAYREIGDCLFAQVVRIREKKAKGKPLDKSDREFYNRNKDLIDVNVQMTTQEKNILEKWG